MPRKSTGQYPPNWDEISLQVKIDAGWKCIRCDHKHEPESGYMLTVHHLDLNKSNCNWWNIPPLCQRCHLRIQGKVDVRQPWMFDHSSWFIPYIAGFYAYQNDLPHDRKYVMDHVDDLLKIGKPNGLRSLLAS